MLLLASNALLRSFSYFDRSTKLCDAAVCDSLKMNPGAVGELQGTLMTFLMISIKLFGQSACVNVCSLACLQTKG